MKKMALSSNSDFFLWVDSDRVLPKNAISSFMAQMQAGKKTTIPISLPSGEVIPEGTPVKDKHIMGGWYKVRGGTDYVASKFIDDNVIFRLMFPEKSVIKVDMAGFGCLMLSRKATEEIPFDAGTDKYVLNFNTKEECFLGECVAFGNQADERGYDLWMNGDVVCEHLA
jgi:hypothetical protein